MGRGRKVDHLPPLRRPDDRKGEGRSRTTSHHYAVPTTNTPFHELDLTAPHEAGLHGPEPWDDPWGVGEQNGELQQGEGSLHAREEGGLEGFLVNGEGDGGAFGRRRAKGVRRPSAFGGGVARRGCHSSKRGQGIAL